MTRPATPTIHKPRTHWLPKLVLAPSFLVAMLDRKSVV